MEKSRKGAFSSQAKQYILDSVLKHIDLMKSVKDFQVQRKKVLVRSSLNVPLDDAGNIEDDFRLKESVPTIRYLSQKKAKCVIIGHLGRPEPVFSKKTRKFSKEESLKPIARILQELLGKEIRFIADPIGKEVQKEIARMAPGDILMLENMRFYKGEQENDDTFARQLARLGDFYVNDAFDVCHRANASVVAITKYLPSAAGLVLEKEISALRKIVVQPAKPMIVIVGGAKVETKASFLERIARQADAILLGNLMSREIKQKMPQLDRTGKCVYATDGIPGNGKEFDLGPRTLELFLSKIKGARTIFWAGPLGKIEEKEYEKGSLKIARAIIKGKDFSVVGGGDLVGFLGTHGLREKFNHVSTGGGAMLAFLAGEPLPGLEALEQSADFKK